MKTTIVLSLITITIILGGCCNPVDTITLKYGTEPEIFTLPNAANREFESIGNWAQGVGLTEPERSDAQSHSGSWSLLIVNSDPGAGSFVNNYAKLPAANNAIYKIGHTYSFSFWARIYGGNFNIKLKTGGIESDLYALTTNWAEFTFEFTAEDTITMIQVILETSGTACYIDDISVPEELNDLVECEIGVLIEKGLTRAEKYSMFPEIINAGLDGSKETQYKAFIRSLDLTTKVLTDEQMVHWLYFCLDNDRKLDYSIDGITETDLDMIVEANQEITWLDDFKFNPFLQVNLQEGIARISFPNV